jgi:hypothetical protein
MRQKEGTTANMSNVLIDNESDVAVDGFGEEGCRSYGPK